MGLDELLLKKMGKNAPKGAKEFLEKATSGKIKPTRSPTYVKSINYNRPNVKITKSSGSKQSQTDDTVYVDLAGGLPPGWQLVPQFQWFYSLWGGKSAKLENGKTTITDTPNKPGEREVIVTPSLFGHTYDWGSGFTAEDIEKWKKSIPGITQPGKPISDAGKGLTDFLGNIPKYILYAGVALAGVYLLGKFLGRK